MNMYMKISLKLESMSTLCRSAFLPAETTITRRVTATIEVASSVIQPFIPIKGQVKAS